MAPSTPAATQAQLEALLNFIEGNRDLARGLLRGADGRMRSKKLWEDLCNSLNALGGCTKSVEQWQRVWADRKHLAKKAAGAARRSASATGGGPSDAPNLSSVELRILAIMGDGFGEPQTEARVPAFPLRSNVHTPVGLLPDPAATTSTRTVADNPPAPSIARRARRVSRHLPADSARSRIIHVEELRLEAEIERNEHLRKIHESNIEIKSAIVDLCNLVRQYMTRNN
ncbi:hypothetical protein ABMA28_011641 [Loxostege sticticalis]|uniref:Regulatory protein zeste n=1 Tax=Loxostege sticticalis TaxID=481309 RepID=A0ABD0S5Z0_LOXSC